MTFILKGPRAGVPMKTTASLFLLLISLSALPFPALGQSASVHVTLRPAGSFKGTTNQVIGFAKKNGQTYEAKNIRANLKSLKTGIKLRDEHTGRYLEVNKYPEAVLVSAVGSGGKGEGTIRIKGIEKKISGTYKVEGSQLTAQFPIKFSDFNITGVKYMGVGVDDEGQVNVTLPVKN